jgi:hypothetical protein
MVRRRRACLSALAVFVLVIVATAAHRVGILGRGLALPLKATLTASEAHAPTTILRGWPGTWKNGGPGTNVQQTLSRAVAAARRRALPQDASPGEGRTLVMYVFHESSDWYVDNLRFFIEVNTKYEEGRGALARLAVRTCGQRGGVLGVGAHLPTQRPTQVRVRDMWTRMPGNPALDARSHVCHTLHSLGRDRAGAGAAAVAVTAAAPPHPTTTPGPGPPGCRLHIHHQR